jgi:hypothetical protein
MAENHVLLETIELTQSAASVVFDNIPQSGYTDLKVVVSGRTTTNADNYGEMDISFNGAPSGTAYSWRNVQGNGATVTSSNGSSDSALFSRGLVGTAVAANTFSNCEFYIPNYTSSNNKSVSYDQVTENNATQAIASLSAGLWASSAAINSITFTVIYGTAFAANSTFSLYGVAAVGTTPTVAPKPAAPVIIAQPPIQNNAVAAGVPLSTPTVNV